MGAVLERFLAAGITFESAGEKLLAIGSITPALRDAIRDQKLQILAELRPTRAVIRFGLTDGKGGLLIGPAGPVSAVHELHGRYGNRVDWPALLRTFEAREQEADREAAALIRRITDRIES